MISTVNSPAPDQGSKIGLIVADDHPVTREGLALLLHHQPDMTVLAQAGSGAEAVAAYERWRPDVAVLDVQMPEGTGVDATRRILQRWPDACVVLLTTYEGDEDVFRGLQAGAKAYMLKETPTEQLLSAIRAVASGVPVHSRRVSAALAKRRGGAGLTAREVDVLRLVAQGLANKQIAAELGVGEGTIKTHVNSLMSKLDVASRTGAVMEATARGLLRP